MAVHDEVNSFVREALSRGIPRAQVEDALRQAGWRDEQIRTALAQFADAGLPIPVPRPRPSLSARDAFMYLLLFTTLYIVAINLGILLFQFINRAVPDPALAAIEAGRRDALRFALSQLIVASPVFVWISRLIDRETLGDPARRASPVRRWLTYLTLFVAACVLIGDVVRLVNNLLGGELTIRFVLKALVVGLIAGTVFWYYLQDLRAEEKEAAS